jgi:hypothetical protein
VEGRLLAMGYEEESHFTFVNLLGLVALAVVLLATGVAIRTARSDFGYTNQLPPRRPRPSLDPRDQ